MVLTYQAAGRLHLTTNAAQGVAHGELIFLAVGTPQTRTAVPTCGMCWRSPLRTQRPELAG